MLDKYRYINRQTDLSLAEAWPAKAGLKIVFEYTTLMLLMYFVSCSLLLSNIVCSKTVMVIYWYWKRGHSNQFHIFWLEEHFLASPLEVILGWKKSSKLEISRIILELWACARMHWVRQPETQVHTPYDFEKFTNQLALGLQGRI